MEFDYEKFRQQRVSDKSVKQMGKLFNLLNENGIKCRWLRKPYLNQILVESNNRKISAVSHNSSYGAEEGLIEVWDFGSEPPRGWLTASEAFKIIQRWSEEHNDD